MLVAAGCAKSAAEEAGATSAQPSRVAASGATFGDGSVSFRTTDGWTLLQGGILSACITTASYAAQDLQQSGDLGHDELLACRSTAATLPPDGVLVTASTNDLYTWATAGPNFPAAEMPPTLDPSTCGAGAYEGQPPGTTECHVWITAIDRQIDGTVWFGTESPSQDLMATAQVGLDALQVAEPASLGNDIAFQPADGWYDQAVTPTNGGPEFAFPVAWTSNVELPTYSGSYLPAGPSNDDIANLPADGVIVSVEQWIATRNALPATADYQPLTLPLQLSDARLLRGGWEGMAANDVSQLYLSGAVNGRPIIMQAFFRTTDPSPELITQAQIALNRLVVVPAPPPTTALDDFGITMHLPDGWRGWLYAGDPTLIATTSDPANLYAPEIGRAMGPSDITIVLDEGTGLQDLRWPAIDGPPQIGPDNLCEGCEVMDDGQPPAFGHTLYRNTFTSGGRAFDLYVEFGSEPSPGQLSEVNAILQTLQLTPDPSPEPAPPGATAVGTLGERPLVGATSADRVLSWTYEGRESISVPAGWTGWMNLVVDSAEPLNLFALGSWDVPQGGYCAPLTALQQLPSDGALVWIDRYSLNFVPTGQEMPWPQSPEVGPGTEPAPSPTSCTAGVPVQSFLWTLGGWTYAVHVAFGPDVTGANIQGANEALASMTGR
jgi:hypothetical protein